MIEFAPDSVAVVTGAARGIGLAVTEQLVRFGVSVIGLDVEESAIDSARNELGPRSDWMLCDVSDGTAVRNAFATIDSTHGPVHLLVNSAGIDRRGSIVSTPEGEWQTVFDVNFGGTRHTMAAAIPSMLRAGRGSIVNVGSLQALYGWSNFAAYAASKAAIVGLSRQVAAEFLRQNLRCNVVAPGGVDTGFKENSAELMGELTLPEKSSSRTIPEGFATPAQIANVIVFLLSPAAEWVNGTVQVIDGGESTRVRDWNTHP